MTTEMDDFLGPDTPLRKGSKRKEEGGRRAPRARKSLGPLHDLLTEKLPDLLDRSGSVCDAYKLAPRLGITFQGVYLFLNKNKLTADNVNRIVALSAESKHRPKGFVPATRDDFWDFLSR